VRFDKESKSFDFALQNFHAAMQTKGLFVASGIRRLCPDDETQMTRVVQQG
jgi:hypothetical protein